MLPARLQQSPKWLAAGAAAGALGCITAAAIISPVAIGSLPLWALIGAAVSAVVQPSPVEAACARKPLNAVHDQKVRSAALFAMLLELQGQNESTITRVLDRAIPVDERPIDSAEEAQQWLRECAHQFGMALSREAL
jgi:hypothetical protein